ncbi:MAG: TlpA family protein disulfide reductase [Polyangiales bacterium]
MVRHSLLALFIAGFSFACSSSSSKTTTDPGNGGDDDAAATDDTGPTEDTAPWLTYPPGIDGKYGLNRGDIFPNLSFKGYKGGEGQPWTDISMIDYYDPTGERGLYAILYVVSAEWCGPCQQEAKKLPGFLTNLYAKRGAHFMTGVIEDTSRNPADQATVDRWLKLSHLNFDAMADPGAKAFAGTGIPRNYIINPRNMQIVRINTGVNPDATTVDGLDKFLDLMGAPNPM